MDFLDVQPLESRGRFNVTPTFIVRKSKDLMIRGGDFYAIWDEENNIWSTDEDDAIRLIDTATKQWAIENQYDRSPILRLSAAESGMIDKWHRYVSKQMRDNYHQLDERLIFANQVAKKEDFVTKHLPYALEEGSCEAWDKIIGTLYDESERHKLEWAIGSIVTGASKTLQKFLVLYGSAGTGKSTILHIIEQLFDGYWTAFDAKALGSANASFALEPFKGNPLVAIQHDGDLSRIEDNERLNSLVSHETMQVNEKFKPTYPMQFNSMIFMGTNRPVRITDAKSGLLRRLIDVTPSGRLLSKREYDKCMREVQLELGAIAWHCREVYLENPNYYDNYVPLSMLGASNDFYNFMLDSYFVFSKAKYTTLDLIWKMYKEYADDARVSYPMARRKVKEEAKNYFDIYETIHEEGEEKVKDYYCGFRTDRFEPKDIPEPVPTTKFDLEFNSTTSILDMTLAECPAQYATTGGTPLEPWSDVSTQLKDLATSRLHYVQVPKNHIVIDFDIPNDKGEKDYEANLAEAKKWPPTYAELSKSGAGIHLHYLYAGDPNELAVRYSDHIEIKVFNGNASLRRKLTKCNKLAVTTLTASVLKAYEITLPRKEQKVLSFETIKNEAALRTLIKKNLKKECVGGTKPSIDLIVKDLDTAYASGFSYDVSDMRGKILAFAGGSTHHADYCIKQIQNMKFKSEDIESISSGEEAPIVFFDVEVFPNLFLVNWKYQGAPNVVRMINPTPSEIEKLCKFRLIGFNNRRYDNHMLYACMLGYTNAEIYKLSQRIISDNDRNAFFGEAYNLSYSDIYDFASASNKKSLKKWEITLGIHHQELGLPWNEPVAEELWPKVAEYCDNDVLATEALFDHLKGDWTARLILAELADMTPNDTTNSLSTRIIFGREKHPKLIYTDLSETFPGYFYGTWEEYYVQYPRYAGEDYVDVDTYNKRVKDHAIHNLYKGEDVGFGGYVWAKPGMYSKVKCYDVAGMHPASIAALNALGEYTENFNELVRIRKAIKHKQFDEARAMMGGRLAKYLTDPTQAKQLSNALKTVVNSVYGLTSASFENPFRDPRNKNNIVALRGALFISDLKREVLAKGYQVIHCKTDSIKVVNPDDKIEQFIMNFGHKYGYDFEIEHSFERICLVNDSTYIGYLAEDDADAPGTWTATGEQFAVPYVFKTLFSHEDIGFSDMCETKAVSKTAIYLDFNEGLGADEHSYQFVGAVGSFCPMIAGSGGGEMVKKTQAKDGTDKYDAVQKTKGFRWKEAESVLALGEEDLIDRNYYDILVQNAVDTLSKFGDVEWFRNGADEDVPWEEEYFNKR